MDNEPGRFELCEEVLLPNGIGDGDVEAEASLMETHKQTGTLVYYEEQDPEHDPMGEQEEIEVQLESLEEEDDEGVVEEVEEAEEEGEEEEEEIYEEPITVHVRTAQQVPKKRKDAALLAEAAAESPADKEVAADDYDDQEEEEEEQAADKNASIEEDYADSQDGADAGDQPTSSTSARVREENSVDEDQCRVCTTREDLVSIFKCIDQKPVAELLMGICPTVSIAVKDFMPQYICNTCLDHVIIAVHLKWQCESTDRELRKLLSRHKNKVRRPAGYVIIDAPLEPSEPSDEEEEPKDDAEFKVSDEASPSVDEDTDDSDFSAKRRRLKSGRGRGRRRHTVAGPAAKPPLKHKRPGRPPSKKSNEPSHDSSGDNTKKYRFEKEEIFPCDQCDSVFNRKLSLVLHRKAHGIGRDPIKCEVCGKLFKIKGAYRTHLERHKTNGNDLQCPKCEQVFVMRCDLRRHLVDEHNTGTLFSCDSCKRSFVSQSRLDRHLDSHCHGNEGRVQRKPEYDLSAGKDLFKSVAPLTTTYWSDSFSD